MKLIFVICALLNVVVAQEASVSCNYEYFAPLYYCQLSITNPNGFDDFTGIGGIHLEGFSNANVTVMYRINGMSTIVPRIVCDTFPNLDRVEYYNTGLTRIDDTAFAGCSQASEIVLLLNRITSISANAFSNLPNLRYINLEYNSLSTLPENVFANQQNVTYLDLGNNPFAEIPAGLFRPLENLQVLYLGNANLNSINNQWFTTNTHLDYLYLGENRITLAEDSFVGLDGLSYLVLSFNGISEIPANAFARLPDLQELLLYGNQLRELEADSFPNLGHLDYLDIGGNPIGVIHDGAFRGLTNLTRLNIDRAQIRQLNSNSFEGLDNLIMLLMNFNLIEELPQGVFAAPQNLNYIGLWGNRLKTLRRNVFGTLTNLEALDVEGNLVNALDRAIIDDAVRLRTLYFSGNLCANNYFGDFGANRALFMFMLDRCFTNMRYIIETTTEGDDEYAFFEGPQPGIAFRVNTDTDNEVQIALTPFNFVWTPIIEILIGTANNTRSVIRLNEETDVVTVPTPNIITPNQWNDFRITWSNQVVLVYSSNNTFPFMAYTMQDFFPVNFYGLRAVESRAHWSIQPFDF